jgi:tetratricopeptide (TPR) repeat protein
MAYKLKQMRKKTVIAIVIIASVISLALGTLSNSAKENTPIIDHVETHIALSPKSSIGSASCRNCHENFYKLWATSHHGLAMQPFTVEFAKNNLTALTSGIAVGNSRYGLELNSQTGWIVEYGQEQQKKYSIQHVLGGKNVYYFLTPMDRGRLQVLPIAYDVNRKEWFDTTASMIRHFSQIGDEPLDWNDRSLTFNTSCYSCHVSQLSTNYDIKNDSYNTTWAEPGINCETCHGPCDEHLKSYTEAVGKSTPEDLKLISTKTFSAEQTNSLCAPCHAKMRPLTDTFKPGDRYFDHFDLVTLEDLDFYPDGRDLGENYTYTSWLTSPCVKSGELDCVHCHTSSGRFKQSDTPNNACMPCHKERVEKVTEHSHHPKGSKGSECIGCHMPTTEFARMRRSDHSMLPPTPAATIKFKSPNACNLCHSDKDATWADKEVRKWHGNYQVPVLHRADLIENARKQNWNELPKMLEYITSKDRDEVFAASLIRLLEPCNDDRKWRVLCISLTDPSPLVRSVSAAALATNLEPEIRKLLLQATEDDCRLVRIQAAGSLSGHPAEPLNAQVTAKLEHASREYVESLQCRPDDALSHYNLGNYYFNRGQLSLALDSYGKSLKLSPNNVLVFVNASLVHAQLEQLDIAKQYLLKALKVNPRNPEANFNLALLMAQQGDELAAEKYLRMAIGNDKNFADAAYNLGVLLARKQPDESIQYCRKAYQLRPDIAEYGYTLSFYLWQQEYSDEAIEILKTVISKHPAYAKAYMLLRQIYESQRKTKEAAFDR